MKHFIYVFSEDDKTTLLKSNYKLVKEDKNQNVYVFENKDRLLFDFNQIKYVQSDILTF